jgi:Na+-translocating ferredoxin:NAD+ oxidoreductase RnfD subunit
MSKNVIYYNLQKINNFIPKDGRWFLGGSHLTLCFISFFFYNFQRSIDQILLAYLFAFVTEIILFKLTDKYKDRSIWDRLFSAATEAAGLIILVKSGHLFFYAITSSIAVASKYFFRVTVNKHLFNPTNFAIVLGLCIFPTTSFNLLTDEFTVSHYPIFHVLIFGLLAVWRGKTWPITLGYFLTFVLVSTLFEIQQSGTFWYWLGPEIGAIGLIFMFLMITDPQTTPTSLMGMLIFGISIALVKIILKSHEVLYPHFIAAFIVTIVNQTLALIRSSAIFKKVFT